MPFAVDNSDVLPAEPPETDVEAAEGVSIEPEAIDPDGFYLGIVEREVVGTRRVQIVFDREGKSRELFDDSLWLNFDFTSYRKGNCEPLDESESETVSLCIPGQPAGEYETAESTLHKMAARVR